MGPLMKVIMSIERYWTNGLFPTRTQERRAKVFLGIQDKCILGGLLVCDKVFSSCQKAARCQLLLRVKASQFSVCVKVLKMWAGLSPCLLFSTFLTSGADRPRGSPWSWSQASIEWDLACAYACMFSFLQTMLAVQVAFHYYDSGMFGALL